MSKREQKMSRATKRLSASKHDQKTSSKRKKQDEAERGDGSEIPITIAMSSDILFQNEQYANGSKSPGPLFAFFKALKTVNGKLKEKYPDSEELFRVLLIGDNSESLRNFIREHGMKELITLKPMGHNDLIGELKQEKTHLYLAAEQTNAREAANAGIAAATVSLPKEMNGVSDTELRVAFDDDGVLFSNESEQRGQKGISVNDNTNSVGPFKGFLEALEKLKRKLGPENCPIRTYLVTSHGAGCAGYRALNTLRVWGLEMDEAVFLGGAKKGPTLARIKPHIFFDDKETHIDTALNADTLACLVP